MIAVECRASEKRVTLCAVQCCDSWGHFVLLLSICTNKLVDR